MGVLLRGLVPMGCCVVGVHRGNAREFTIRSGSENGIDLPLHARTQRGVIL
jgi:hypothetical protein